MTYRTRPARGPHLTAMPMPVRWEHFLDGMNDVDASFENFIGCLDQLSGRTMLPQPKHILQLIVMIAEPAQCFGGGARASVIPLDPLQPGPFKVASRAFAFLTALMRTAGADSVLRCLPGYELDPNPSATHDSNTLSSRHLINSDKIYFTGDAESPMLSLVKRSIHERSVWDLLWGPGLSEASSQVTYQSNGNPEIQPSSGTWDLLELLTIAWELDYHPSLPPKPDCQTEAYEKLSHSPHLLRQFPERLSASRLVDDRLIKLIFYPFSDTCASETYVWGRLVNTREHAKKLVMRVLALLQDLESCGKLEPGRLVQDMVHSMMSVLDQSGLHHFINRLPAHHPKFNARLLMAFLEVITRGQDEPIAQPAGGRGLRRTASGSQTNLLGSSRQGAALPSSSATGLRRQISQSRLRLGATPSESTEGRGGREFPLLDHLLSTVLGRAPMEVRLALQSGGEKSESSRKGLMEVEMRHKTVMMALLVHLRLIYDEEVEMNGEEGMRNQWNQMVESGHLRDRLMEMSDMMLSLESSRRGSEEAEAEEDLRKLSKELEMCRRRFHRCLRHC